MSTTAVQRKARRANTARYVRVHRERRAAGLIVLTSVVLDEDVVDFFAATGLLPPDTEDPRLIAQAVQQHFKNLIHTEELK